MRVLSGIGGYEERNIQEAISIRYTLSGMVLDSKLLQGDQVCTIATDLRNTIYHVGTSALIILLQL
jgi:hypothetical protein